MTVMENFGNYLKHERELRGIPLEEIADHTKIHMRFLEALENNHFDSLPGEVFIKGYIRSYAKSIGTNAEEMLTAYDEAIGKHRREQMFKLESEKSLLVAKRKNLKNIAILCISLAVIAAGGFYLHRFADQKGKSAPKKNVSENAFPATQTETVSVPGTAPSPAENASAEHPAPDSSADGPLPDELPTADSPANASPANSGETASATGAGALNANPAPPNKPVDAKTLTERPASEKALALPNKADIIQHAQEQSLVNDEKGKTEIGGAGKLTLTIQTQENSWFNLVIDSNTEKDFILPGGSKKQFLGDESFIITIGNKKGASLLLNGKPVNLPQSSDNVIRNFAVRLKETE